MASLTPSTPLNSAKTPIDQNQGTHRKLFAVLPDLFLEQSVIGLSLICLFNLPFSEAFKEISLVGGMIASLLLLLEHRQTGRFFIRLLTVGWPVFLFVGVSFASGVHSINTFEGLRGAWGDLETLMGLILFSTLLNVERSPGRIRKWMLMAILSGTFSGAAVGLFRIWNEHRPFLGMMNLGDKNTTAQFLSFLFLIVFFFHSQKNRWNIPFSLFVVLYPILAVFLFLTHSRTFLIAVPVALLVMIAVLKWWKTLAVVGGFLFCLLVGTAVSPTLRWEVQTVIHPMSDGSFESRYPTWEGAIRMWKAHPFLGVGPDNFHMPNIHSIYHLPDYAAHGHNVFFNLLGEYGALGVIAFFLWLTVWVKTAVSGLGSGRLPPASLALCLGTMVNLLIGGIAHPMWGGSTSLLLMLAMALSLFPDPVLIENSPNPQGRIA